MHADLDTVRLSASLGAGVRGISLAEAGPVEAEQIEALLMEHQVLFFPGQHPSVDEHVEFGRHFGRLAGHPNLNNPFSNHPELFELAATHGGIADEWHSDLTFHLTRWVANPRFTLRYRWSEGTVAMWDNRCTQHVVLDDFDGERIIQRVTVVGDVPEGVRAPRWEPYVRGRHDGATSRFDFQLNQVLGRPGRSLQSNRKNDA